MNCHSHYLFYQMKKHSYRELPIRYHTQDVLHRNEATGVLSGLTRVRQFQQDDAHIILMESQIPAEVKRLTELIKKVYESLGLGFRAKFGTRLHSASAPTRSGIAPRRACAPRWSRPA